MKVFEEIQKYTTSYLLIIILHHISDRCYARRL